MEMEWRVECRKVEVKSGIEKSEGEWSGREWSIKLWRRVE